MGDVFILHHHHRLRVCSGRHYRGCGVAFMGLKNDRFVPSAPGMFRVVVSPPHQISSSSSPNGRNEGRARDGLMARVGSMGSQKVVVLGLIGFGW